MPALLIILVIAVGFAAGCGVQNMPPIGPSICVPPEIEEAAALAVDYWNRAGTNLDSPGCPARISVKIVPIIDGKKGITGQTNQSFYGEPEILIAQSALTEQYLAVRTIAHELGHALGFSHVTDKKSAMYPSSEGDPLGEPCETDKELVRSLR